MKYVDKVRGGEGDVCNADDKKRGPCYGAWKTPWEDKCEPDYVHRSGADCSSARQKR